MASVGANADAVIHLPENSLPSVARVLPVVVCLLALADFVFRGIALAFSPGKTDFTELYTSAWLWRHGQNFYDSALVTRTAAHLAGSDVLIAPVYPPTTVIAVVPFTFLPWPWANLLWLLLALFAVGVTIALLIPLGNFQIHETSTYLLVTVVLAFDPIHQAFHLGNIALLVVPLCLAAMHFAQEERVFSTGILLSFATLLKPQLGIWVLIYYLIQRRKWFLVGAALPVFTFSFILLGYPVPAHVLISTYRLNLEHWFGVGRPYGFTEGALPFHVNNIQVILFQLWHRAPAVNVLAHAIFLGGLVIWLCAVWRGRFRAPVPLVVSSLIALSFVSLYHSVSDVAILTLALCWALKRERETWTWPQRLTCLILLLMLLPGHSALMRITPHLTSQLTRSWWWKLFVARYFVWLLFALNVVLLRALVASSTTSCSADATREIRLAH